MTGLGLGLHWGETTSSEVLASEIVFVEGEGGVWGSAHQSEFQGSWERGIHVQISVRKLFFVLFTAELEVQVKGSCDWSVLRINEHWPFSIRLRNRLD